MEESSDVKLRRVRAPENVDLSERPRDDFLSGEFCVDEGGEIACLEPTSVDSIRRSVAEANSKSDLNGWGGGV